jgi:hypothetical protein
MLNVRPPARAARNWREFLVQIATITIGLLLAVSLERGAEAVSWHLKVKDARERLNAEITRNLKVYVHRDDVAACIAKTLQGLRATLRDVQARKPTAPVAAFVSPENGPIRAQIWKSLVTAQVVPHLSATDLDGYSNFYFLVDEIEYFMDRESRAWRQLHLMEGDPKDLTPQDITLLRIALGEAEEISPIIAVLAKRQVDGARALGIEPPKPDPTWRTECGKT